jgi:hypothetical protein
MISASMLWVQDRKYAMLPKDLGDLRQLADQWVDSSGPLHVDDGNYGYHITYPNTDDSERIRAASQGHWSCVCAPAPT